MLQSLYYNFLLEQSKYSNVHGHPKHIHNVHLVHQGYVGFLGILHEQIFRNQLF